MTSIETYGKIESGKLILHNRRRFAAEVAQAKDQEVIIIVKKRGRRSNAQNSYLFGVVYAECKIAFLTLGHRLTLDEVHEFFKGRFLPVMVHDEHGTVIAEFPGSTATLNKTEFSEYIENIRAFAAEHLSISIPDPGASNEMMFE